MRKLLKIIRNQAMDSSDQKLIDNLRNEAAKERSIRRDITDLKNGLIKQISSTSSKKAEKQIRYFKPKWIFALGGTCLVLTLALFTPESKLRLLIPGEREKLDRQIQVLQELESLQNDFQVSLNTLGESLNISSLTELSPGWTDMLPGYQALLSLTDIREEFLQVSPFDILQIPQNSDFKFLYQKEWDLIKNEIIGQKSRKRST